MKRDQRHMGLYALKVKTWAMVIGVLNALNLVNILGLKTGKKFAQVYYSSVGMNKSVKPIDMISIFGMMCYTFLCHPTSCISHADISI